MTFQPNPISAPTIMMLGNEQTKIIVIDDFAENVSQIREVACKEAVFSPDGISAFPGIRAPLTDDYINSVLSVIDPLVKETYGVPAAMKVAKELAYFSLITKQDAELNVSQRIPHFDTNNTHYYAVLHYLNEGNFSGTGFFRHRPTGFERISEDRKDIFIQSASAFMAIRGIPQAKYLNRSTNHFELFAQVDYKPNRLVIYPGSLLHTGLISASVDVCADPQHGRLTANIFVNYS
jgi:hypothetical protein